MLTLLLNSAYESLTFITFRRAIKLIVKDKVEVISTWDTEIQSGSGRIKVPAILRLKYYVIKHIRKSKCSRISLFKRDNFTCQYCGHEFKKQNLTIDHVIPKKLGGKTSWLNCVTCCSDCNKYKSHLTPEKAGMRLLKQPTIPTITVDTEYKFLDVKHKDWELYIKH